MFFVLLLEICAFDCAYRTISAFHCSGIKSLVCARPCTIIKCVHGLVLYLKLCRDLINSSYNILNCRFGVKRKSDRQRDMTKIKLKYRMLCKILNKRVAAYGQSAYSDWSFCLSCGKLGDSKTWRYLPVRIRLDEWNKCKKNRVNGRLENNLGDSFLSQIVSNNPILFPVCYYSIIEAS